MLNAIYWNHRHSLFGDLKIRRALTMAINRRELVQVLNFSENTPIFDTIFSWGQIARGEIPEPLPYDPERAKQLLEEAGWRDQDGDGIRERAGEEARFTAMVRGDDMVSAAVYVQAQLRRMGIQMEIRPLAASAMQARLRSGEFEAAFGRFANDPRYMLQYKWFSPDSPIGYSNPQIVKLLRSHSTGGPQDDQIYRELIPIFCEELPITFLYPQVWTNAVHRRIRWADRSFGGLEDAWLEEEKQ